jgi:hypothetical protein
MAATAKSIRFSRRNSPRTYLAMPTQPTSPSTTMTFQIDGFGIHAMMPRMRKNTGKQITISMMRESAMSIHPP